jgi:hypothetical protein
MRVAIAQWSPSIVVLVLVASCGGRLAPSAPARTPAPRHDVVVPPAAIPVGRYACSLDTPGSQWSSCCDVRAERGALLLVEPDGGDPLRNAGLRLEGEVFTRADPHIGESEPPRVVRAAFRKDGKRYVAELDGYTLTLEAPCTNGGWGPREDDE